MDTIILSIAGLFALTIIVGITGTYNMELSDRRRETRHTGGKTKRQTRRKKIIL